jgi:nicotinate-nucleotide adenylyltransferase
VKKSIAILGGAFNPITKGHVKVAQFVMEHAAIDEVWFMPCYKHVYGKDMVSDVHRLNMILLAIKKNEYLKCFDYEIRNKLSGSTYAMIQRLLTDIYFAQYRFHLIIGMDNANTFNKWIEPNKLKRLINFIVVPRQGIQRDKRVGWYLKEPHYFLDFPDVIPNTSSTQAKQDLCRDRKICPESLCGEVHNYIIANNLYRR